MGKSSSSAPDPTAVARSQQALNQGTASQNLRMNMIDQVTPHGSVVYQQSGQWDDGTPRFSVTQNLTPGLQGLNDQNIRIAQQGNDMRLGAAGRAAANPFRVGGANFNAERYLAMNPDVAAAVQAGTVDSARGHFDRHGYAENREGTGTVPMVDRISTAGLPAPVGQASASRPVVYDFADAGQIQRRADFTDLGVPNASADTVYNAMLERDQPQIARQREALRTQLSNSGIPIGSEAYTAAMDQQARGENDFRLGAQLARGQEQSRLFNLGLQQAGFGNQAQGQQFGQNMDRAGFHNQAQGQEFGQSLSNAQLQNQLRAQLFGERVTAGNFQNAQRAASINEGIQDQIQPFQIAAAMQGAQLPQAQFINTPQAQVPMTDITSPTYANYQAQQNRQNSLMGGLFGLGGAAVGGLARGGYF